MATGWAWPSDDSRANSGSLASGYLRAELVRSRLRHRISNKHTQRSCSKTHIQTRCSYLSADTTLFCSFQCSSQMSADKSARFTSVLIAAAEQRHLSSSVSHLDLASSTSNVSRRTRTSKKAKEEAKEKELVTLRRPEIERCVLNHYVKLRKL